MDKLVWDTLININESTCLVKITNIILEIEKVKLYLPISNSNLSPSICFEPHIDGCYAIAKPSPFTISDVNCPLELEVSSAKDDLLFWFETNFGQSGQIVVKRGETKKHIIFIKQPEGKFHAIIEWKVTKNNLAAHLKSTELSLQFSDPFKYESNIYDKYNKMYAKDVMFNSDEKIMIITKLRTNNLENVKIINIKSDNSEVRIVPFQKNFELKANEVMTIASVITLPSSNMMYNESIAVFYKPLSKYDQISEFRIKFPELRILAQNVDVSASFPSEMYQLVPSEIYLELSARKDSELLIEVRENSNENFIVCGMTKSNFHMDAGEIRKLIFNFTPLKIGLHKLPEIRVMDGVNIWRANPSILVKFTSSFQ
ncbi:hypothetical protein TVAG_350880 [Trichomonas vaginalis G3]|uniref:Trafficking protein particle complex subunit 11 C-terminal domain-containing protein n=1 Tax=Trichomonas vaginalis (strain ATCC PRA-98 / G3) TaxID=412133 RepID=A2FUL4_TRIV3|nr:gryzun golgi trafficking family [Trichomonas vaginalis G3]EAX91394.1 hypothetical protein TVAG_350880 [Trichomonas vaginalis G3]KAI5545610.1 gryzun golgi trafficking family [Trichomonas vaginalis G3]|eukprot:XP_001304324.1 hypothetical protein [Trichomonas vaginalis G3]